MQGFLADLMAVAPGIRRELITGVSERELAMLLGVSLAELGTPFGLWRDDCVGFVEDVLGETLWSRQRQVLDALMTHKRVAVPAGFGVGKTHLAARAVLQFVMTRPVGASQAVTTATRMRQVARQMWPHIRRAHARAGLPGECDRVQLKMPDSNGVSTVVAYGFSPPDNDESAMQGIHSGSLLLVVDEAGGIAPLIGQSTRNLLTGDARMLAIGNPPTDDEGGWFERLCQEGDDPERTDTVVIPIPLTDSPAITREDAGLCRDHPESPAHTLASHMPGQDWIDDAVRDFGPKFPRGGSLRIIPTSWVEDAVEIDEPTGKGWLRLDLLGLVDERAEWLVESGAWVRLGVDVAADGGDELVIARAVGDLFTIEHTSAGQTNANAVDVAGKILREILRAQALRVRLGTAAKVRVKVDCIGVGWGVASVLTAWGTEGRHDAEIVPVNVAENTGRVPDGASMVPFRKRDEMWIAGRELVQPRTAADRPLCRLRVDHRTVGQLSAPTYRTTSSGQTQIESKKSMKARGITSPDRAEAVLLCAYEQREKRRARIIA